MKKSLLFVSVATSLLYLNPVHADLYVKNNTPVTLEVYYSPVMRNEDDSIRENDNNPIYAGTISPSDDQFQKMTVGDVKAGILKYNGQRVCDASNTTYRMKGMKNTITALQMASLVNKVNLTVKGKLVNGKLTAQCKATERNVLPTYHSLFKN